MNYKTLYITLAQILTSLGCFVCDQDVLGHATLIKKHKAFIYINSKMDYRQKFFVLAHEAGHLFYMKKGNLFNWAKKIRNEKQANFFAIQLLRLNKIDVQEYYSHYNEAKKKMKIRKKSWFEIKGD